MEVKRKKPVDIRRAEEIINSADKENNSLKEKKKINKANVNLQINGDYHKTLKTFSAENSIPLYELYEFALKPYVENTSLFLPLLEMKKSEVTLMNSGQGWLLKCPLCGKESILPDNDGRLLLHVKEKNIVTCHFCDKNLSVKTVII